MNSQRQIMHIQAAVQLYSLRKGFFHQVLTPPKKQKTIYSG